MKIKLSKSQWEEVGIKAGWKSVKTAGKYTEQELQRMFDEQIAKRKTPEQAAEIVMNMVSGDALNALRGPRRDDLIRSIVRKFTR